MLNIGTALDVKGLIQNVLIVLCCVKK